MFNSHSFSKGDLLMFKKSIIISNSLGVHIRIAAEIVNRADSLKHKYNVDFYVRKSTDALPIAISMIALLSLKIKYNDIVEISCGKDDVMGESAVNELCDFISSLMTDNNKNMNKIDDIIEQSNIANEQILGSISVGIIVVDANSSIIFINEYGLHLIDKTKRDVIGKSITDVIPTSDLPIIVKNKESHRGSTQFINGKQVIVTRSPIYSGNKVIGAVGVFQDISELIGMKELNEKFKKILESSGDLICFVDENRKISYMNPAYLRHFPKSSSNALGKDLIELSPDGLRMKVFNSREKVENQVYHKDGIDLITTIEPLSIDGTFKGILVISRPVNEIKNLLKTLEQSQEELNYYKEELLKQTKLNSTFSEIIGSRGSLKDSLFIADKASRSVSTVLIRGESGTGKEVIAKAIHNGSNRKDKPFIRVNCAAIPENLLESELFGHEKGAFTGAVSRKPGKFSLAQGGTIFLDEIGDMPKTMQVKLLRVLQEKEFESIGGISVQKTDARVIAATNRNLEDMMAKGEFREDLYYRLNVMTISLPPLRDRKEDICILVEHFIDKLNNKLNNNISGISKEALACLLEYNWPGNIRELENVIERAINLCEGQLIGIEELPLYVSNRAPDRSGLINVVNGEIFTMEEYEKEIISLAMKKYKSFNKAGKVLGLTHRTVALKCEKYGILKTENDLASD